MIKEPTPHDWRVLFMDMPGGEIILDKLIRKYGGATYVRGGHEADREQCFRAGQRSVVDFILREINKANGVTDDGRITDGSDHNN